MSNIISSGAVASKLMITFIYETSKFQNLATSQRVSKASKARSPLIFY
jgi:hypothetical protein